MNKYTDKVVFHHIKGDFEYLTFKALDKYSSKLNCFITLRHGGKSSGVYKSLNLRNIGNDNKENVIKNINIICKKLNLDESKVYKASQKHTDNILILNNENKEKYKYEIYSNEDYDGYIIKDKNISNFITTADCNPLIIYDKKQNIVANVHAGWNGVIKQIYLKCINILICEFSSKPEDLIVCIGPSIRNCCFSSEDENFKSQFINIWKDENKYICYEENSKRFHIDLIYLIKYDLEKIGILKENIQVVSICTCCNEEDFFSYRKNTMRKDVDYATFSTWVSLK